MMISTHMAYGFVFAFIFASILAPAFTWNLAVLYGSSGIFAMLGALGGIIPDLDRMEQFGMAHRKTLHYPVGWGILALLLIGIARMLLGGIGYSIPLKWIVGVACLFSGAWLHSFMDIFDDFYMDPTHAVYEHISRKWIKPFRWIPFASLKEWSLQSFCMIGAIAISPYLAGVPNLRGSLIGALVFLAIWLMSTIYEFRYTVPNRLTMINEALKKVQIDKD